MLFRHSPKLIIPAILLAAFCVRVAAGVWWQQRLRPEQMFAFGDSESYWGLARSIVHGEPYQFGIDRSRIFRTPGYPLLLAPLFIFSSEPSPLQGRIHAAAFSTMSVGLVALLTWQLFGQQPAIAACVMAAFCPDSVATGVFVLSEAPFCPFMLLQFWFWNRGWRSESTTGFAASSFASGIAAGIATLVRPSWLLFTPFAIGLGVLFGPRRSSHLSIGALSLLGFCVAMSPWWVRNYQVAGKFVPTTLQVGASLYDGLHEGADGGSDMRFVEDYFEQQKQFDAEHPELAVGLFEERLDRRMHDASVAWAKANPRQVFQLAVNKFYRIWNPLPLAAEFQNPVIRWGVCLGFVPILLLAVWGVRLFALKDWTFTMCVVPAVYFTALHMIFVGSMRYRQPAMLTLMVLAAGALVHLRSNVRVDQEKNVGS